MRVEKGVLAAQTGKGFTLEPGDLLRVTDLEGGQVADLFCFDLDDPRDSLSSGRSIDYNDTIRFTKGHRLYSFHGKVMLEMLEDSCGVHDFLVTPCSLQMFRMLDPDCGDHPSCQSNLAQALAEFGFEEHHLGTTFNIFMNVPVNASGRIRVEAPVSRAGDFVVFRAHRRLALGLTACADEGTNGGRCKPIGYELHRFSSLS